MNFCFFVSFYSLRFSPLQRELALFRIEESGGEVPSCFRLFVAAPDAITALPKELDFWKLCSAYASASLCALCAVHKDAALSRVREVSVAHNANVGVKFTFRLSQGNLVQS